MAFDNIHTKDLGTVEGVDDLTGIIDALGDVAFGKVLKSATNAAMTPVVKAARANARAFKGHKDDEQGHTLRSKKGTKGLLVLPGFTAKHVTKKTNLSRDKRMASSIVTVEAKAFYAVHFVERGHAKKGGGTVAPQPWLVPAMEANVPEVVRIFGEKMSERIQHAIDNPRPTRRRRRR